MQVLKPELAKLYGSMSLGEYVHQQGYSQAFISNYLLPMCAAVWSVPNAQVTEQPVNPFKHARDSVDMNDYYVPNCNSSAPDNTGLSQRGFPACRLWHSQS